jgi:hypothetical protein
MTLRVPIGHAKPENRANHVKVKVDGTGRASVGTMAYDKRPGDAALYRVDGSTVTLRGRRPGLTSRRGFARVSRWPVPPSDPRRGTRLQRPRP